MAKQPKIPTTTTTPKRRKVAPAPVARAAPSNGHAVAVDPAHPLQPIAAEPGERVETRACPVALTERERVAYGDEIAECELQVERLKAESAALSKVSREHALRRNKLSHIIDSGVEERPIDCVWRADYTAKEWRLLRCDSGSTVESRTMTGADLVQDLFSEPSDDDGTVQEPWTDDDSIPSLDITDAAPPPTAAAVTRLPPPPRRSDGPVPTALTAPGHDVA